MEYDTFLDLEKERFSNLRGNIVEDVYRTAEQSENLDQGVAFMALEYADRIGDFEVSDKILDGFMDQYLEALESQFPETKESSLNSIWRNATWQYRIEETEL